MKRVLLFSGVLLASLLTGGYAAAQAGYLECTACQMVLGLVESTSGSGAGVSVDARKQCSLLREQADRERCERFWAEVGPKFIKALKDRRAKGEGMESICRSMGYCP